MDLEKMKKDTKNLIVVGYREATKKENLPYTIAGLAGLALFNVFGALAGIGGVYFYKKNKKK